MIEYKRKYHLFSLCGLNCGLCPRFQTDGISKCPGCGGPNFHLKHPSCAVITCNKKYDNVEYCFQCSSYPCKRYRSTCKVDSFISYLNVIADFEKAGKKGIDKYRKEMDEKVDILEFLIQNYNDGKRKSFYCIAVNLLSLDDLRGVMSDIKKKLTPLDIGLKNRIQQIAGLLESKARKRNVELKLRK